MRPSSLNPLFANVITLDRIGPRMAKLIATALGHGDSDARVVELLWHVPHSLVDRTYRPNIANAEPGRIATLLLSIGRHHVPPRSKRRIPYRIDCHDDSGAMSLVFFSARGDYLSRQLPEGEQRWISGKVDVFSGEKQIAHPDFIVGVDDIDELPAFEPVYGLTAGLSGKVLWAAVQQAIELIPSDLPEWIAPARLADLGSVSFLRAMRQIHQPESFDSLAPESPARRRLAYDEIFAGQLALQLIRRSMGSVDGRASQGDGTIAAKVLEAFPYPLTGAQARSVEEITADMASSKRMVRLLQGDVGAGKTIVALLAAAQAAECNRQSAFMAPTEILARQHFKTLKQLGDASGLTVALLTGREKGKEREAILSALRDGQTDILVGTHALFQSGVEFNDLALAIIDEQHRFGVHQRMAIAEKGRDVDYLVMTATPIPRTLLLTLYGDMQVSRLDEKPPGRTPIDTRAMPAEKTDQIIDGLTRALADGSRVYWICPLIEDSPELDAISAESRFEVLKKRYGDRVGLVHGRMKGTEKDAVMAAFATGEISILVATTVVEVGVDVPEATIMVIENAERFGLAQLHQLRGRVGRGSAQSSCLLIYKTPLGETAHQRLAMMRESDDGFDIAEADLRLRGSGDLMGTRQSGLPGFMLVDAASHLDLLQAGRDDAHALLATDPNLTSDQGQAARYLLYLFARDEAAQLMQAG